MIISLADVKSALDRIYGPGYTQLIKAGNQRQEANYLSHLSHATTDKSNKNQAGPEVPVSLHITFKGHGLKRHHKA